MSESITTRAVWRIESLCALADHVQGQDRYREAESLLQRALEMAVEDDAMGPAVVGRIVGKLGALYRQAGRLSDAEANYRRALALAGGVPVRADVDLSDRRVGREQAEHVALAIHSLGLAGVVVTKGEYDEAEHLLRAAYAIFKELPGENSPEVATAASALAGVLSATDRATEAADLYREAVAIHRTVLPPGDPLLVSTLHNFALLQDSVGRPEEARALWAEAESALAGAADTDATSGAAEASIAAGRQR
jgi:tetratricopeptide (TPR) repeat protein